MTTDSDLPRPFGSYELVRRLSRGAVAEVFLARARSVAGFEKAVALKRVHPELSADPEFSRLLVEEAHITAQLSHKNVVQVFDLGETDGAHYLAMEYVDGLDLSAVLERLPEHRVPPRVAAYVVREVCEGLDHAHRKVGADGRPLKIVHRDVSPSNILVSFSGEVKLTDFGLARATSRAQQTRVGELKGRHAYLSPEQARGQAIDARTDVYAAGLVLYEMLTGRRPWPELPVPELVKRVAEGALEPAGKVQPGLPAALLEVLSRATAPDPAQRYPTARALGEDLASFLYTQPPGPEMELSRMAETAAESARTPVGPLGARLVEDTSDDVTKIETTANIRARFSRDSFRATAQETDSAAQGGRAPGQGLRQRTPAPGEPRAVGSATRPMRAPTPARPPEPDVPSVQVSPEASIPPPAPAPTPIPPPPALSSPGQATPLGSPLGSPLVGPAPGRQGPPMPVPAAPRRPSRRGVSALALGLAGVAALLSLALLALVVWKSR
ncbi:MAG: protein kinase [Deltaproteobacteria bacterium]|nr:protein kinase [Deltaproteobacteria bacterium]